MKPDRLYRHIVPHYNSCYPFPLTVAWRTIVLTAGTLMDGARMYAAAADAVNDRHPNALHVLSHLLGMSIELTLKAFLLERGRSEKDLRRMGHDLGRLLKDAESLGLVSTGSRHFRLAVLGANYDERLFAYPEAGRLNVILPKSLREIAHELICEVFVAIKGEAMFAELSATPGLSIQSPYPEDIDPSGWAAATDFGSTHRQTGWIWGLMCLGAGVLLVGLAIQAARAE